MNESIREIKIVCFAGLRKFFDSEIHTQINLPCTYKDLLDQLGQERPDAVTVLKNCRVAIDEAFMDTTSALDPSKKIFLIPPSSGG